jgi:hypothetical protein
MHCSAGGNKLGIILIKRTKKDVLVSALNRNSKIVLTFSAFLIVLVSVAWGSSSVYGASQSERTYAPLPTSTPGLVVYGVVRDLSGSGVENVNIYRSYAGYSGIIIATTVADGSYQSDFYYIPGDEMVTVWADRSGLEFKPMHYSWRHYYSYEYAKCNFQAHLPWVLYIPIMGKFSIQNP